MGVPKGVARVVVERRRAAAGAVGSDGAPGSGQHAPQVRAGRPERDRREADGGRGDACR